MEAKDYARWLQNTSLLRFNEFRDGLNRRDGRSWPRHATTYARKAAFLLPVTEILVKQGSSDKAQELIVILIKHALRNI